MFTSAREISELNIKHYCHLLEIEKDPAVRRTIEGLLGKERASLAKLQAPVSTRRASELQPSRANEMD
ncbi:hypothetical protein [Reyranella sp.]|uniref:hypothetical protein n=1 Tax=Reyranella sp. TaxID=1929291 RepID=UPI0037851536